LDFENSFQNYLNNADMWFILVLSSWWSL